MNKTLWRTILMLCCLSFGGSTSVLAACGSVEYREFDFWLGTWQASLPNGKIVGINRIQREYEGCVIHERYTGGRNYNGESLNIYDPARKVWHQTWVDNTGTLLVLEGGLHDGKMILEGNTIDKTGATIDNRITWTPNPNGSVHQLWESTDDKVHWKVAYDSVFTRM